MTLPKYRVMVFLISLLGLIVPVFEARPVFVMIVSQAFQSIILPVTVACILYLGNRSDLMGEHRHTLGTNIFLNDTVERVEALAREEHGTVTIHGA